MNWIVSKYFIILIVSTKKNVNIKIKSVIKTIKTDVSDFTFKCYLIVKVIKLEFLPANRS